MKTAVVGCGAVGCYYGAKLAKTGEEVHFLIRSDWESITQNGVRIISDEGNVLANPMLALVPEEIGHTELVIVALKSTANHRLKELVGPLIGPETTILTLQNGLGSEAVLADLFGAERVLGGLCFVCLHRIGPGIVHHFAYGKVAIGEFAGLPSERTHAVARYFRNAGLTVQITDNLDRSRWEKLVWNIPFNGLGVAGAAGTIGEAAVLQAPADGYTVLHDAAAITHFVDRFDFFDSGGFDEEAISCHASSSLSPRPRT
ncbi:MAG: 2-dehydropantoate 2-reductase [Rhodospirillales bacterium]|nr:2-dehydropantoate 2-reductase [Rhodospirillales bacterium]